MNEPPSARVDDGRLRPPAADGSPLLGQVVHGRYAVERELGWGSLGRVYLAHDLLLGRRPERRRDDDRVALKVIRRDRLSPESIRFLKREFRALASLDHPHVARVYDLDVIPGRRELFFTLE